MRKSRTQIKHHRSNTYRSITQPHSNIHYLYMRSFYDDVPVEGRLKEAIAYYRKQSAAILAGLQPLCERNDRADTASKWEYDIAKDILASLRETAISSEELGMYGKKIHGGVYWNQAAVETQALLIEAFAEIEARCGLSNEDRRGRPSMN